MPKKLNITGTPVKVSQEISDRYFYDLKDQVENQSLAMELEEIPSLIFHRDGIPYCTKYLIKAGGQPLCFLTQKEGSSDFTIGYADGKILSKKMSREVRGFLKERDL